MLNSILELVVCNGSMCGTDCGRWTTTLQDDDANLWKDLTLQFVPDPRPPPVPEVVQFPECSDDVSALNGPTQHRHEDDESYEPSYHDLELRVEVLDNPFPKKRFTFSQSRYPRAFVSRDDDCDGSSYSSCKETIATKSYRRKYSFSWQTDSTDATMQAQNRSVMQAD